MADATEYGPDGEQTVFVPWEWAGPPGDEVSGPIFGHMELPRTHGGFGPRLTRRLRLPAPGEVANYRLDVPRACIGRLTYQLEGHEVTQLVHLVKGFNVVQLRRGDEPTP